MLELLPKTPGVFLGINNEDNLLKLESLNYYSLKANKGQQVGKASDGYKMCAVIILFNKDTDKFNEDLEFINKNVYVVTA